MDEGASPNPAHRTALAAVIDNVRQQVLECWANGEEIECAAVNPQSFALVAAAKSHELACTGDVPRLLGLILVPMEELAPNEVILF